VVLLPALYKEAQDPDRPSLHNINRCLCRRLSSVRALVLLTFYIVYKLREDNYLRLVRATCHLVLAPASDLDLDLGQSPITIWAWEVLGDRTDHRMVRQWDTCLLNFSVHLDHLDRLVHLGSGRRGWECARGCRLGCPCRVGSRTADHLRQVCRA
jgi:hypothetical protein